MSGHGVHPATSASERGVALVAAVLFAMVVMAYATSLLFAGRAMQEHRRYYGATHMAQDAAESGVHELVALLSSPAGKSVRAAGFLEGTLRGDTARAQRYEIRMTPAGDDGADNDLDGKVDEPDETDMLEVESTGRADNVARTVRVTLLARYAEPAIGSATYIGDFLADLKLNGNSFLISGVDVTADRVPTGARVPGIGVAGNPGLIRDQITKQAQARVVGLGESPSVYEVAPLDLRELIDAGARAADVVLPSGTATKPSSPGEWGTLDVPSIAYGTGSIHVSGGATGAGILIVDGDLTISGNFQWWGLVIVRGEITFSGGGNGKMITGAVIVEKKIAVTGRNGVEMTVNGTVDVLFSKQTIAAVMRSFATYTIVNWREGPNPDEAMP